MVVGRATARLSDVPGCAHICLRLCRRDPRPDWTAALLDQCQPVPPATAIHCGVPCLGSGQCCDHRPAHRQRFFAAVRPRKPDHGPHPRWWCVRCWCRMTGRRAPLLQLCIVVRSQCTATLWGAVGGVNTLVTGSAVWHMHRAPWEVSPRSFGTCIVHWAYCQHSAGDICCAVSCMHAGCGCRAWGRWPHCLHATRGQLRGRLLQPHRRRLCKRDCWQCVSERAHHCLPPRSVPWPALHVVVVDAARNTRLAACEACSCGAPVCCSLPPSSASRSPAATHTPRAHHHPTQSTLMPSHTHTYTHTCPHLFPTLWCHTKAPPAVHVDVHGVQARFEARLCSPTSGTTDNT